MRVLKTLINPHNVHTSTLDRMDELSEIRNRARTEIVHHGQISAFHYIACEGFDLSFWSITVGPEPVFDVDTPVHNIRVVYSSCEYLACSGSNRSVWGSEVSGCEC